MKAIILQLADENANLETVGGKGMSLARMSRAGLPVPGGFHISTEAYREFVALNQLQEKIQAALQGLKPENTAGLEKASAKITALFADGSIPPVVEKAIREAYAVLVRNRGEKVDIPVAVRSSATAEDLPDASFAGQQETYLNIRGVEAVMRAVKKCWASLWTARAIAYRLRNNIDQQSVTLAVVVQELVFADAAGILFTANPVNSRRGEMVINAAWGLGEAIVSGAVSPDTLVVDKKKMKVIQQDIADKQVMSVRTVDGIEEQPVAEERRRQQVISKAQAIELCRLGLKIEELYGAPMDIEWTYSDGSFQIVQARPITTLDPEWVTPIPGTIYARGSLAEHIPSPVTPLFATLGLRLANRATYKMWQWIMGEKNTRNLLAGEGMYVAINGYVFGGMRMGAKQILPLLSTTLKHLWFMSNSVPRWQKARTDLKQVVDHWQLVDVAALDNREILKGISEVFEAACVYFTMIQTCLPAASMGETVFARYYNTFARRKGDPAHTTFLLGFNTRGLDGEKSLYELAEWAKDQPDLAAYLKFTSGEEVVRAGNPANVNVETWQEWQDRFARHLAEYGNVAYEFDFSNPTPLETPAPMIESLKAFLNGTAGNPYTRQREAAANREKAEKKVTPRLIWPFKVWFVRLLRWAQETAPMREDSIADMGMGHPLLRQMFAELGNRLVSAGAFPSAEDIYWLEEAELISCLENLENNTAVKDYSGQIEQRRADWKAYIKLSPPVILPEKTGWSKMMHGEDVSREDGKVVLKGIGTSSGRVTAPACVLTGPEDFSRMKPGDVLVAVTSTPAWTPLFTLASAVVTDIGGPLSHSSIVAREYNIPAVMAARGATRAIQQGQMVTVDGTTGKVILS